MPFVVEGLSELMQSFSDIAELPDSLIKDMLNAEADVVVAAQKKTASTMLRGPYNKKAVEAAVTKKPPRKGADGYSVSITFEGAQHNTRLAEIAFINEFGKVNQAGRPFIETANEQSADEAVRSAAKRYDQFLKSKGL